MEPFNGGDSRDPWDEKASVGTDGGTSGSPKITSEREDIMAAENDGGSILDPWGGPIIPND